MKKKIKSRSSSNFFYSFCVAIFVCFTGAAISSVLFYRSFFRALTKMNETPIATITFKYKTAQRKFLERVVWDRLQQNSPVYNGDTIHTSALSEATIWFSDGNIMELSENTMAQVFLSEDKSLKAELSDGFATIDSSTSEKGMKLSAKGVEVAVNSGSSLSAQVVAPAAENYGNAEKESFAGNESEQQGISLQVKKGNIQIHNSEGKTIDIQEGEDVVLEGTKQTVPSLAVKSPAVQSKFLYHDRGLAKIPFSWNLNGVSEKVSTSVILSKDKKFSEIECEAVASENGYAEVEVGSGTYYWKILVSTEEADGSIAEQTGKIQVIQSIAPELISPASGFEYSYRSRNPAVRLIWTEADFATSYKLEIADNPQMNTPFMEMRTSLTSAIISTLAKGEYWWRVTPYYVINRKGFASPSATGHFSIAQKGTLPVPCVYIPFNNGIIDTEENTDNVSFSWKQESEAESYTIKIADNPLLNNPKITETTSSNFILLDLKKNKLKDGKYYWAVFMTDFEGNVSEMSEPRSFFAMKGKPEQHLIEPAEGFRAYHALVPDTRFTWKRKLPENFISRLQIAIDEKFSHFVYDSEITGNSFKGANLELGTYYWRLVSKSDSLETELMTPARTLVVTGNLEAADLINPSDYAVARENVPYVFEWNEVEDADYYKFSIFRQSDGTLIHDDTVYDLQTRLDMFNNPKFEDKAMYKWQIQAFSNGVPGVASRRIGNISEKDFYLVKLRPVEIDFPPKNMQVNGIDAVLSPISARWSSVDSIEKAQFVLTKTDETPPREILRIPSDIQMQSGNKIAPSQILLDTKDGLRAGKYEIIVYAQNADGIDISNTERKNRGYFSVLPVPPLKTAENLKAEPSVFNAEYLRNLNNPKEIRLSWEKVPDATEYLLSIKKKNEKKALLQTVVNDKASYTLDFKILSDKDKSAFSKGNFAWSVKPVRRIDSDKDGIPDKLLQEGKEAKSSFMTDIPILKKSKAKGASNPYGN